MKYGLGTGILVALAANLVGTQADAAPKTTIKGTAKAHAVSGPEDVGGHEDWKGISEPSTWSLGALTGFGILDNRGGFAVMGTASRKIFENGFISSISNSASIETELGPLFTSGSSAFMYNVHLRWDFQKDEAWALYGLGGFGGAVSGAALGSRFAFYPRFGLGVMRHTTEGFSWRAELSHELIALGLTIPF